MKIIMYTMIYALGVMVLSGHLITHCDAFPLDKVQKHPQSTNSMISCDRKRLNLLNHNLYHVLNIHGGEVRRIDEPHNPKERKDADVKVLHGDIVNVLSAKGIIQILANIFAMYSNHLHDHPLLVKMASSAIIGGLGDYTIQSIQNRNTTKTFDSRRCLIFTIVATFYISPVIHYWFNYLNFWSVSTLSGLDNLGRALAMTLIDQTIGAIVINTGFFLSFELVNFSLLTLLWYFDVDLHMRMLHSDSKVSDSKHLSQYISSRSWNGVCKE